MPKVDHVLYGDRKVFAVSAFNEGIERWLRRLPDVWVEGEVTELRRRDSWANVFFTLKDPESGATLPATIARSRFDRLELGLAEGERVHAHGRGQLYAAKAELTFRATVIERFGLGDHLAALERLKRALAAEGLFDERRKRRLPRIPRAVGVLTGSEAAARGDILAALATRFPPAHVVIVETRVQGRGAAEAIIQALERLAAHDLVDVIVVARGGGSFEDLLPFSDERVVRAFAACPVPVVSAVGHEQDQPLCDLAADARAATPTAAVRLVVPAVEELRAGLDSRLARAGVAVRRLAERDRSRLTRLGERLRRAPQLEFERRLAVAARLRTGLDALAPLRTLARGYAIVRHEGVALTDATAARPGDQLDVLLARGGLTATAGETRP